MPLAKAIATACYQRDSYRCRHCNNRSGLHPHHVVYKSHGGEDRLDNLITLCNQCHIDGVHGGKLLIELIEKVPNNVIVRFTRKKGWKPK